MRLYFIKILSGVIRKCKTLFLRLIGYKNIHPSVIIETGVKLDLVYPQGVIIGENTLVGGRSTILSHDHIRRSQTNASMPFVCQTKIGARCFIGIGAIILPGVTIGDEVVIGAGSVVTKNIPSNSIAAGNPCRLLRVGIKLNKQAHISEEGQRC